MQATIFGFFEPQSCGSLAMRNAHATAHVRPKKQRAEAGHRRLARVLCDLVLAAAQLFHALRQVQRPPAAGTIGGRA